MKAMINIITGLGLGLFAIHHMIEVLLGGSGIVIIKPFPIQKENNKLTAAAKGILIPKAYFLNIFQLPRYKSLKSTTNCLALGN